MLDVPIYDMAFDDVGRLWATTGGGPLVLIDPSNGRIIERFSDRVSLGLAIDHANDQIYVSTGSGIELFDIATHRFKPFSSTVP